MIDANPSREQRVTCAKGIAYLYLNMKKWDHAKKYDRMASELDPNHPEPRPFHRRDRLDGLLSARMEERAKSGMKPEEHLSASNKIRRRPAQSRR